MKGQWIGRYSGSNEGQIVIDLDDVGDHYEGRAFVYDDNSILPSTFTFIRTPNKDNNTQLTLDLLPVNPHTGDPSSWEELAAQFPNVVFPQNAEVSLSCDESQLRVSWKTNIETKGSAEISKSRADEPTEYKPLSEISNWSQFKTYVTTLEPRRYIFRGQRELLRLRTGFHRTGRSDLAKFLSFDIPTLHRHLSQRTSHIFNLAIAEQNGAFFNLVQHHGYPTPLLDWTYSPFVAAFFAYRRVRHSEAIDAPENDKVRLFMFDQKAWRNKYNQVVKLTSCRPHFSIMEFISIDNERLIPQQSISSITNVDDIESYIRSLESNEQSFLQIIDLPLNERPQVMSELSMMGITAGSLFPGLDGACEELRERHFQI